MENHEKVIDELGKIPWFQALSSEHLQKMAEMAHIRRVKAGEILFREGGKEDYVYIVIEGRVGVDIFIPHRGKVRIYTADPLDVFGWSSVTPSSHRRTAGATAVVNGLVVGIDSAKLRDACETDHDFGYIVMRRLLNIVSSRLLVSRLQLLDMFESPEA
ncbi:MAG TPA: Crp/Fnr family transcriptional regulator [Anaerolineales bacterium]|nr:Crp/Fnr family transcriptional regulator [Anaerolineales bacterium]